jgi:hypothetical protein
MHCTMPMISPSLTVTSASGSVLGGALLGVPHHRAPQDERDADGDQRTEHRSLDHVTEDQAHDPDRQRAEQDGEREPPVVGLPARCRAQTAEEAAGEAGDVLAEEDQHGRDGAALDDRREAGHRRVVDLQAQQAEAMVR